MLVATERRYLEDSYLTEFSARVVRLFERDGHPTAILDATCFYPTSGGQPSDRGILADVPVLDVIEEGEDVLHALAGPLAAGATVVKGCIDWGRRFDHMQQHTGQHILSQSFVRALRAETVSFHLGEEVSTIDLDVASLNEIDVARAEEAANAAVFSNREVRTFWTTRAELAALEVRGATDGPAKVRIVEIVGFDRAACGGTHCRATGEVGVIKVHRWGKVRGRQRLEFTCGGRALRDYQQKERSVRAIARLHNVSGSDVVEVVRRGAEELQGARRRAEKLLDELFEYEAASLVEGADVAAGCRVVRRLFGGRDVREVRRLAEKIASRPGCVALLGVVGDKGNFIFARSEDLALDLLPAMEACCKLIGGRGGGRPDFVQGGGDPEKIEEGLNCAYTTLFH